MQIKHLNYNFIVYLALVEGIALYVLDVLDQLKIYSISSGFLVGFIPALIVLMLYRMFSNKIPVMLDDKKVTRFPIILPSVYNGIFIVALFSIQNLITKIKSHMLSATFGFISVFLTFLVLLLVYNLITIKYKKINIFKLRMVLDNKKIQIKEISLFFAIYAGLIEAFILPLIYYISSVNVPALLTGFLAGFIGCSIGLLIINFIIKQKPLDLNITQK